jgi:carotenoid cleavage dioxygenase-like enzyme
MTSTALPHLAGNYAPVTDELTCAELPVDGAIPPELTGWYLRNGPNPVDAASGHWFLGDGMVHGVRLAGGRALAYRNRWVRTSTFTDGASVRRPDGSLDLTAGVANTHVVRHAGRVLALVESSFPTEITPELDTIGPFDFAGRLTTAMTAHPKTCPTTGELHFFGYATQEPYLTYHRADAAGELVLSRDVEVLGPTMMHDFALTARHVVFLDLPVVHDPAAAARTGMDYRWAPERGARIGVLRRDDPLGPVRWFPIEPCYVYHVLNAHDAGDTVVLHAVRHDSAFAAPVDGYAAGSPPALWRWSIDLATGAVADERLDDTGVEFPRIDDRLAGLDTRFGHAVATARPGGGPSSGAILRYDLHTGAVVRHDFGPGRMPAEAAFAPADDTPGGAGWLLTFVHDAATDSSELVILDTTRPGGPPTAVVHLPHRVPYGFHGNWLPDAVHC